MRWPIEVVAALAERHPGTLAELKDSSGDVAYSTTSPSGCPAFHVFPSSEATLGLAKERGFAGCISATTNHHRPLARIAWHQAGSPRRRRPRWPLAAALRAALSTVTLVPVTTAAT